MIRIKLIFPVLILSVFNSCENNPDTHVTKSTKADTTTAKIVTAVDTIKPIENAPLPPVNDSLNDLANFISGNSSYNFKLFSDFRKKPGFTNFSTQFSKRWISFDSTKLLPIKNFVATEFATHGNTSNVFYPFSGPDILYSSTLFPDATQFSMIGLEPVGTLPIIDDKAIIADSIQNYFDKINGSLNAILKFSFFRTISMKEDLRNNDVDGTIHLILLFLNKTQHEIVSIKPFYIDTLGNKTYVRSTLALSKSAYKNKSIEVVAIDKNKKVKTVTYTSTDLSDAGMRKNKGLVSYINNLNFETTYLKGASYLMHKPSFSEIRKLILTNTDRIVQDDSGIAINYITNDKNKWKFTFYGEYTKPINMFTQHYQQDLDSLYKLTGSKKLGFGLGYNYRDKNSNFMVIKKLNS
jgi:hypothetical protein